MSTTMFKAFAVAVTVLTLFTLLSLNTERCTDTPQPKTGMLPVAMAAHNERVARFGTDKFPRIYIFEELRDTVCNRSYVYYDSTSNLLWELMKDHPWRERDPEKADIFWVPFDTRGSYWAGMCAGRWHHERFEIVWKFIRANKYYVRHQGRNFFWDILYWQVLHADNMYVSFIDDTRRQTTLRNVILGTFLRFWRKRPLLYPGEKFVFMPEDHLLVNEKEWRRELYDPVGFRTVLMPVIGTSKFYGTPERPPRVSAATTFEDWLDRPGLFYFRGGGRPCRADTDRERQFLYDNMDEILKYFPRSTILPPARSPGIDAYEDELGSHKFCLILRCDGPAGSRFFDAISSDCMPVILSDSFMLASPPFVDRLNYNLFTFNQGTKFFQDDPVAALDWAVRMPIYEYKKRWNYMQEVKRALLWMHPRTLVHEYTFMEVFEAVQENMALEKLPKDHQWALMANVQR